MENLNRTELTHAPLIARPTWRMRVHVAASLDDPALLQSVWNIADGFAAALKDQIGYVALQKATGAAKLRLAKKTTANFKRALAQTQAGLEGYRAVYLQGASDDGTNPGLPAFSFHHYPVPAGLEAELTPISTLCLDIPVSLDAAQSVLDRADGAIRTVPVIAGTMGLGFSMADPNSFAYAALPAAHLRYRCALMSDDPPASRLVRYDAAWVQTQRLRQRRAAPGVTLPDDQLYDYMPGVPDIGWRTYVGQGFRDRLASQTISPVTAAGGTVEDLDMLSVVTAGPAPIWGDINTGEDIMAYQAVAAYLAPAMADRALRIRAAPGHTLDDKQNLRAAEAYVDRFVTGDGSA